MGVHGLSTFINDNPGLFTCDYELKNTHLVIDASNLMNNLAQVSQQGKRADLFGGNMVEFGIVLNKFYDNLEACKIVPIMVMDGAQTYEVSKSKVKEKLSRSKERFNNVMKVNNKGFGHFIFPATANVIFKSVAVDRGIQIYQSFFEADMEVARLACEYNCPALSDDSDFYLVDLPHGLIPISSFKWQKPSRHSESKAENWRQIRPEVESNEPELCISCKLFKQQNFKNYLPNLDIKCLPLIGPLLGNDFIDTTRYAKICHTLPAKLPLEYPNPYMIKKLQTSSFQHEKIVKILCFCCDKTPLQVINQLSMNLPKEERSEFKKKIKSAMRVYHRPLEDTYVAELRGIFEEGFKSTYAKRLSKSELDVQCEKNIQQLANWLIKCSQESVMTHKILELLNKNVIFLRPHVDDLTLPSAHQCQQRIYAVILRLLRPTTVSKKPIEVYDRVGSSYDKTLLQQIHILDGFGKINYLAYDVPTLPLDKRRQLVLATFYSNYDSFVKNLIECNLWLDPKHGDEFVTVWMIMDYIDIENPGTQLWKEFRQATLLCLVYYLCIEQIDENFSNRLERTNKVEFAYGLKESIKFKHLAKIPTLGQTSLFGTRNYDCRLMHQISQLHASIAGYNVLNSFLGDPLTRLRAEYWLNSCLIYNLSEAFRKGIMKVPGMPDIIVRGTTSNSFKKESLKSSFPRKPPNFKTKSTINK